MPKAGTAIPNPSVPDRSCGNCGAAVAATDITCPACDVLLAAYQAPAGSTSSETAATHDVPSPAMTPEPPTAPEPSPAIDPRAGQRPPSRSPIGDALRRDRGSLERTTAQNMSNQRETQAREEADTATGASDFEKEVNAELTGARVTFDHGRSVIETDQVDITQTPEGEPSVVAERPAPIVSRAAPAKPLPIRAQPVTTATVRAEPVPDYPDMQVPRAAPDPSRIGRWLPYIIFGCVFLGFARSFSGTGVVIGIMIVGAVIFLLMRATRATSRKTTSMPRDTNWKGPRRR